MSEPNTSATGGYLQPASSTPLPGGLSFHRFIQTMLVGISGLSGDLVRPKWQPNPPKQPDGDVNWLAFALQDDDADTNAFSGVDENGHNIFQRMETLEVPCSFYGPASYEIAKLLRDGLQIPQNTEAINRASMGFVSTSRIVHVPDLVNEIWVNRYEMSLFLRREILRSYPIVTFLSVSGTLTVNDNPKTVSWAVTGP